MVPKWDSASSDQFENDMWEFDPKLSSFCVEPKATCNACCASQAQVIVSHNLHFAQLGVQQLFLSDCWGCKNVTQIPTNLLNSLSVD